MDYTVSYYYCGIETANELWLHIRESRLDRIYYPISGHGGYIHNNVQYNFQQGHLYVIPKDAEIIYFQDKRHPFRHLYYDFILTPPLNPTNLLDLNLEQYPDLKSFIIFLKSFFESQQLPDKTKVGLNYFLRQQLSTCLYLINLYAYLPLISNKKIEETVEYIHQNYFNDIKINELAQRVFLNESYFIRIFKSIFSKTPYKYLQDYRLINANYLLSKGKSVSETAASVGFSSVTSFTKCYKNTFGYPPSKYNRFN